MRKVTTFCTGAVVEKDCRFNWTSRKQCVVVVSSVGINQSAALILRSFAQEKHLGAIFERSITFEGIPILRIIFLTRVSDERVATLVFLTYMDSLSVSEAL